MNRASETKASQSFFLRLELGIPEFALPLPFFFELHATEEMFKGDIQITQSLLWSALRDRVHPGQFALLQLVEFAVQFHRTDTATGLFVDLLLAREAPIVSESCSPGMLLAGCDLLVIQVKFGSIAPRDLHRLLSYTENTKNETSIVFQYAFCQVAFLGHLRKHSFDCINQIEISTNTTIMKIGRQGFFIAILYVWVGNGNKRNLFQFDCHHARSLFGRPLKGAENYYHRGVYTMMGIAVNT